MIEKMGGFIVDEHGSVVDLGSDSTLYIPSTVEHFCYDCLKFHKHIDSIIVDEGNTNLFVENNCLMHRVQADGISESAHKDGNWIKLIIGGKNSIIPKMNHASHYIIGSFAFNEVDIKKVELPQNINEIGMCAFADSSLEEIYLNDELDEIGHMAFRYTNLKSIVIPKSTRYIGFGTFAGCNMLESIIVKDGNDEYYSENNCLVEKVNKNLIACVKNATIPRGVEIIEVFTFYGMDTNSVIYIPDSVKKIGKSYFNLPSYVEYPVTFKAHKGSYAIKFAKANGIKYIEI